MFLRLSAYFVCRWCWINLVTSENHLVPFSKFCVNCLLRIYFVCCNNCVLKDVIGTCWCNCLLAALRVPGKCFWPPRSRENLNFSTYIHVFDLVLKSCWYKWRKLARILIHFLVLIGIVASVTWLSFCYLCFRIWMESFSYFIFMETFACGFQKWSDHDWNIFEVLVGICLFWSTSYLHGVKLARSAQFFFLLPTSNLFDD